MILVFLDTIVCFLCVSQRKKLSLISKCFSSKGHDLLVVTILLEGHSTRAALYKNHAMSLTYLVSVVFRPSQFISSFSYLPEYLHIEPADRTKRTQESKNIHVAQNCSRNPVEVGKTQYTTEWQG